MQNIFLKTVQNYRQRGFDNTVVAVDLSASAAFYEDRAKNLAREIFEQNRLSGKISVMLFNHETFWAYGPGKEALETEFPLQKMEAFPAAGGSNLEKAVSDILSVCSGKTLVILFSDGQFHNQKETAAAMASYENRPVFLILGMGNLINRRFLWKLASESGGGFFVIEPEERSGIRKATDTPLTIKEITAEPEAPSPDYSAEEAGELWKELAARDFPEEPQTETEG